MGTFSILWATIFSWAILFAPKLYAFFKQQFEHTKRSSPSSSGRCRTQSIDHQPSFLKPIEENEMNDLGSSQNYSSLVDVHGDHKYLHIQEVIKIINA